MRYYTYSCDICGAVRDHVTTILRCSVCGKKLCWEHYHYDLICSDCLSKLTSEEEDYLRRFKRKYWTLIISVVVIKVLIDVLLYFVYNKQDFIFSELNFFIYTILIGGATLFHRINRFFLKFGLDYAVHAEPEPGENRLKYIIRRILKKANMKFYPERLMDNSVITELFTIKLRSELSLLPYNEQIEELKKKREGTIALIYTFWCIAIIIILIVIMIMGISFDPGVLSFTIPFILVALIIHLVFRKDIKVIDFEMQRVKKSRGGISVGSDSYGATPSIWGDVDSSSSSSNNIAGWEDSYSEVTWDEIEQTDPETLLSEINTQGSNKDSATIRASSIGGGNDDTKTLHQPSDLSQTYMPENYTPKKKRSLFSEEVLKTEDDD